MSEVLPHDTLNRVSQPGQQHFGCPFCPQAEPFLTGFVEHNGCLGRPVDVLVMADGSMLVSDDHNGAIHRISWQL